MPDHLMQQNKAHESYLIRPAKNDHKLPLAEHAASSIFAHQQALGNQLVQGILQSRLIQAKLVVNPPDDEYEKEADQVADAVMRMPDPQTQGIASEKKKDDEEKEFLQTKLISGQNISLIQREIDLKAVEEKKKKDEEEMLLRLFSFSLPLLLNLFLFESRIYSGRK